LARRSPWASSPTRCSRRSLRGSGACPAGLWPRAHHLVSGRTGSGCQRVLASARIREVHSSARGPSGALESASKMPASPGRRPPLARATHAVDG
jgi:hypothetical protein